MSMLAERRRKTKWTLNPRGSLWAEDTNKFGQKMLEKMGWKEGKGLGAKEDGKTEHVKITYKNDSRGMGFKDNGEQWTEHEDKFTSLLKSLDPNGAANGTEKLALSGKSLEEKSQKSRVRVHYHKFTRGKDLSRYSEKDLANIFGKKSLTATAPKEEGEEKQENNNEEKKKQKFGVDTVERGSMVDYFKQKFPYFTAKSSYDIGSNGVLKSINQESDSETEEKSGFGFGFTASLPENSELEKPSFVSYVKSEEVNGIDTSTNNNEKNKKKKKRKLLEQDASGENEVKKVKLENSHVENENCDTGFVNPAFDPLSRSKIVGIKHSLTTINEDEEYLEENSFKEDGVYEETPKLKKKKKMYAEEENPVEVSLEEVDSFTTNSMVENPYEVKRKSKKSKKRKISSGEVEESYYNPVAENETLDQNSLEDTANSNASESYEVKRKSKKNKKKTEVSEINDAEEDNTSQSSTESKKSKKKKMKKSKTEESGLDNPALNLSTGSVEEISQLSGLDNNVLEISQESVDVDKKKNKKLKKSKGVASGLDNPALNITLNNESLEESAYLENESIDTSEKKSKKKKSKKSDSISLGLDNPALNISLNNNTLDESSCLEQVTTSVEKTKKKKSKKSDSVVSGLDNPALNVNFAEETLEEDSVNLSVDSECKKEKKKKNKSILCGKENIAETPNTRAKKKSVRFSEVNEEHIIPNVSDVGLDNAGFDLVTNVVSEGVENLNRNLDEFQNELENDMNERKLKQQELNNKTEENSGGKVKKNKTHENFRIEEPSEVDTEEHGVILKYREGMLRKHTINYRSDNTTAKKSYKHLVQGDILVHFKGTNFHYIEGYAVEKKVKRTM